MPTFPLQKTYATVNETVRDSGTESFRKSQWPICRSWVQKRQGSRSSSTLSLGG
ncbi:MAG TPA: hypothetical protein IGR15_00660 [Synechococcus sp. M44_DOE_062]|nr:hypothetical protein [Synechococcus sp. M44_DOE_062]